MLSVAGTSQSAAQSLSVNGGTITMTVSSAVVGQEPTAVVNSAISLSFRRGNSVTKITVATSCPGQRFNLAVVAASTGSGTPASSVNLVNGMLPVDLIVDIPAKPPSNSQSATLQYTASATFAQGNSLEVGNDVHTVSYTIIAQ